MCEITDSDVKQWLNAFDEILKPDNERSKRLKEFYDNLNNSKDFPQTYDENKYPKFDFKINYDEIVNYVKEDGNFADGIQDEIEKSSLAKLLYAIVWKNGDLQKLGGIVHGIRDAHESTLAKKNRYVFYQFGKYLANRKEPIIDQHTIRAQILFENWTNNDNTTCSEPEIVKIRKKSNYGAKKIELEGYITWLKKYNFTEEELFYVDKIMFMFGKYAKINKRTPANAIRDD